MSKEFFIVDVIGCKSCDFQAAYTAIIAQPFVSIPHLTHLLKLILLFSGILLYDYLVFHFMRFRSAF